MLNSIRELTKEYIDKDGYISAEMSIRPDQITEKFLDVIFEMNQALHQNQAKWIIHYCEICKGHNAEYPLHLEIIKVE